MTSIQNILVIAGPTASGKTAVGIELAQRIDGEIVSADARQIYRFMNIGTAKPTAEERAAARHHLIDFVNPDEDYSAGQFAEDAADVIGDILRRGKVPIVVGGAGLYIRALFDGFSPMPKIPMEIRVRLQEDGKALSSQIVRKTVRSRSRMGCKNSANGYTTHSARSGSL